MAVREPASKVSPEEAGERLLVEAAQKDPTRFAELYENNFERVYVFIARRIHDRDEAEDLTSDVFQRAIAHLPRYEWRGVPFAAWLLRIAANSIADRTKRAAKERNILNLGDPAELSDPEEVSLEEINQRARLFRLVDGLPADQRRVIVMRFAEQRSIREIAREIRRTEGAVKQLQFRGLENLRTRMGKGNG